MKNLKCQTQLLKLLFIDNVRSSKILGVEMTQTDLSFKKTVLVTKWRINKVVGGEWKESWDYWKG